MAYFPLNQGSDTAADPSGSVKAKTESQTLLAANRNRVCAYIANDGEKTVYLGLGATAVKNEGIPLPKGSAPFKLEGYTGVVSVVTAEGESVTAFSEV